MQWLAVFPGLGAGLLVDRLFLALNPPGAAVDETFKNGQVGLGSAYAFGFSSNARCATMALDHLASSVPFGATSGMLTR